jgi:hypothetical protein
MSWDVRVVNYRMYRLDGAGRIDGAEWIDAEDDDEARSKARIQRGPGCFELWQQNRPVERSVR